MASVERDMAAVFAKIVMNVSIDFYYGSYGFCSKNTAHLQDKIRVLEDHSNAWEMQLLDFNLSSTGNPFQWPQLVLLQKEILGA